MYFDKNIDSMTLLQEDGFIKVAHSSAISRHIQLTPWDPSYLIWISIKVGALIFSVKELGLSCKELIPNSEAYSSKLTIFTCLMEIRVFLWRSRPLEMGKFANNSQKSDQSSLCMPQLRTLFRSSCPCLKWPSISQANQILAKNPCQKMVELSCG